MRRLGCSRITSFICLSLTFWSCAQKASSEKTFYIQPVSPEEENLIRVRLESEEALRPYEDIFGLTHLENDNQKRMNLPPLSLTTVSGLASWMQSLHGSTLEYFKNYPGDQAVYLNVLSNIPNTLCFEDGTDTYCGPGLLSGFQSLLPPSSWQTFHDWLTAIAKAMIPTSPEGVNSAAFQYYARYFVFGIFKPLQVSSPFLTESACHQAREQLEATGEKPREWEIDPCKLVFAHKRRGVPSK